MNGDRLRIDKWLWFARFAKTRTAAQKLVAAGRVRVNREKSENPARLVRIGDVLTLALQSGVRVLRIAAMAERRGPPAEAIRLYEDLSPRLPAEDAAAVRTGGRPTKRDRRAIEAFRQFADEPAMPDDQD